MSLAVITEWPYLLGPNLREKRTLKLEKSELVLILALSHTQCVSLQMCTFWDFIASLELAIPVSCASQGYHGSQVN